MAHLHLLPDPSTVITPYHEVETMTEEYIKDLVITRDKSKWFYKWDFVRNGQPKVGGYICGDKKFERKRFICFDSDELEVDRKLKEKLREIANLKPAEALTQTKYENLDIQMILREDRASETKVDMYNSWKLGHDIRVTQKLEGLKNNAYDDAIKAGRDARILLSAAVDKFLTDDVGEPKSGPPLVAHRTQQKACRFHLNFLMDAYKSGTSLVYVVKNRDNLKMLFRQELLKKGKLELATSYRKKIAETIRRFFDFCDKEYGLGIPDYVLKDKVTGESSPVRTPRTDVLRKFLYLILTQHIDLLLFVVLQLFVSLRPEEAYRALDNPRQYIIGDKFWFPAKGKKAKASTKRNRNIRLRPLTKFLLSLVPGLMNGTVTNFCPLLRQPKNGKKRKSRSKYVGKPKLMKRVYAVLRKAGYNSKHMPDEILRKCCLSALNACEVPEENIMQEASHSNPNTLEFYIDETWLPEEGIDFWDMFPPDAPAHSYTDFELYHAYRQLPPIHEQQPAKNAA